ncbi:antibiotic biosynthesis monooxygenase [Kibdelosporangium aridum]|uniref:Antibiotic biosynthesis monooxygenase n=1 Tax=Kibdelosporangium aridum TaxID=2030 RepID=A0A428ZKG2_KIBAR|nr:antibiotic biosynthesis monooxygenase [Kibdelosporangium aridum]RSM88586.1 antibiotic biosynthesis monooxygenase [Kibdelosporangium aridum]
MSANGERNPDEPVTAVFNWRAKPGRVDEFAQWARGATAEAARFPGNLAATVVHNDGSRDFHVVNQFQTRRDLRAWLDSAEREKWLRHARTLAATRTAVQHRTGLETWFHVPSEAAAAMRPPPRWKMWLISLVAVYPLVLAFQAFLVPLTSSWPLALRAALFPVVLLTAMTYVVMPVVTRLLRRWL